MGENGTSSRLLYGERVATEPDEMQVPEDPPVVERHLPAGRPRCAATGRGDKQDDSGDPERSHCPSTFAAFARLGRPSFFQFFFLGTSDAICTAADLATPCCECRLCP